VTSGGGSAHIYADPDAYDLVLTGGSAHTPVMSRLDNDDQSYHQQQQQQQQQLDPARISIDAVVQRGIASLNNLTDCNSKPYKFLCFRSPFLNKPPSRIFY